MYILLWCTFTEYHKPWSIRFNRTVSIVWMAMWRYRLVETRLLIASLTSYTYLHSETWSMLNYNLGIFLHFTIKHVKLQNISIQHGFFSLYMWSNAIYTVLGNKLYLDSINHSSPYHLTQLHILMYCQVCTHIINGTVMDINHDQLTMQHHPLCSFNH